MFKVVFPMLLFVFRHVLTRRTPMGRKEMADIRNHGGPMLRVKRADLLARGVERLPERVVGVKDGLPLLDGGRVADVVNVVWCTGFRQAFDWIDLPVFAEDGWPREMRGVVDALPGLYFGGLGFQYSAASMFIAGANRDAAFVAEHIAKRTPARTGPAVSTV
jgi:putative flavoprotein involved in K+ transport